MLSRRAGVAAIFFPVLFSLAASTLFLVSADAQNSSATPDSVGDYVRSEMQTQHIPGLSLLVSKGGQVVRAEGFGLANVELQTPVKAETVAASTLFLVSADAQNSSATPDSVGDFVRSEM